MQLNQRESVSRQNRYLTESRRWCECGRERLAEWAFEGKLKPMITSLVSRCAGGVLRYQNRRMLVRREVGAGSSVKPGGTAEV